MQVRVIRARADQAVGDVVDMPDGAEFSDLYYEPVSEVSSKAGAESAPGASEVSSKPPVLITTDGPRPAETPKAGA
jgi:hypothetical protein